MNITDETKKRNWAAARKMLRLADEVGFPDHQIAELMGKRPTTIAGWRMGNRGGTPMPLEKIESVVSLLKAKKAERNDVPPAPLLLEQKPLHKDGSDAWRDGYATGFEAGIRYAERQAELKGGGR